MTPTEAINAAAAAQPSGLTPAVSALSQTPAPQQTNFADMIARSLHEVETKVQTANALVRQFAVDDSIPVHQVTIALEQARMSVDMALQVRTRLVEAYRELMNMQL